MHRFLVLAFLLLGVLPATASAADKAPCVPGDKGGPTCTWWEAKVDLVADGDTFDVQTAGEGTQTVRLVGINAMELDVYSHTASRRRGECMGVPAANFAERYVKAAGNKVLLAAQRPSSHSGKGRVYRSVWVKSKGRLIDLAAVELQAGLALYLPNDTEWLHNDEYQGLAGAARLKGDNLWDPMACNGPDRDAQLSVVVKWDADGADEGNRNDEYIEVRNAGRTPVDIGGWWARDSWLNWWQGKDHTTPGYRFAPGTEVPAGGFLRLHIGCGKGTGDKRFWCQDSTAFENVTYDKTHLGDGAYLFDLKGGLRASFVYPCVVGCADPLKGKVELRPQASGEEAITIRNRSDAPVDLADHILKYRNAGRVGEYVFGKVFDFNTTIPAGGTRVYEHPTRNRFKDSGGVVELRTMDDQLTTCADWGNKRC